ncbi:MAG: alpha/beta fold hydrolase [Pseudomonadota bacterium]
MKMITRLLVAGALMPGIGYAIEPGDLYLAPDIVHFSDGHSTTAERGYFFVPENREKPQSPLIAISVMRFYSTAENPGDPIFVLAGGPGSSYLTRLKSGRSGSAFRLLLEDLRTVGDVVIPDQRGAGLSLPFLNADTKLPQGDPAVLMTPATIEQVAFAAAREARQRWEALGRDPDGYSAPALARDVNQLREALGYEKFSIYGGSFGSQSTFTIIRLFPEQISRIVVWGIEDIDHTFDMPTGILNSLKAILADAEADPDLAPLIPEGGILAAVQRKIEELTKSPVKVITTDPDTGESVTIVIGPESFKRAWRSGARRNGPQAWPGSLLSALEGDYSTLAQQVLRMKTDVSDSPAFPRAQFQAIDCGLPPSRARSDQLKSDPAIAILGDINLGYWGGCEAWQAPGVSEAFKAPLKTDIDALFLHGTHDLSTPLMNAKSASAGYHNGHLVIVERATHGISEELYRERPDFIRPLLRRFLSGQSIDGTPGQITLPPADYLPPKARP